MMQSATFLERRDRLETYFDRTAMEAWRQLTSDAPVSRIRATVRAGRTRMQETLLGFLPHDLGGRRVLDAGCGVGALAYAAAARGGAVVGVDLSANLVRIARERAPDDFGAGSVEFCVGDMLGDLGVFDHTVAMDSLIHYPMPELVAAVATLAERTARSLAFTFAPRNAALSVMHAAGRLFPRADRAPAIEPVEPARLHRAIAAEPRLAGWTIARSARIESGFYTSQALEIVRR